MAKICAFISGFVEFRLSFTRHYQNQDAAISYDLGRELAHKLTLRAFEQ